MWRMRRSTSPTVCVYTLASRRFTEHRESCVDQLQRLRTTENRTVEEQQRLDLLRESCCIMRARRAGGHQ